MNKGADPRHGVRFAGTALFAFLLLAGCNPAVDSLPGRPPASVDIDVLSGQQAFDYVGQMVAITPRHSGSPGVEQAARFIRDTIAPFTDSSTIERFQDQSPDGLLTFHNVIAVRRGTGSETVILGSHFDTKSGISDTFQGANDSGSSTGLLIELARVLHQHPRLPFNVVFAFFDGEECIQEYGPQDGLHGSRHYVRQLEDSGALSAVRAVIVLDMIGDKDLTVTIPRNTSRALTALAFEAARAEGVRGRFRLADSAILDDHVPFHEKGIPTLNLIDFEYGTAPGLNDLWHTEYDNLENISAESLQTVGRVTLRILNALASLAESRASRNPM